MSLYKSSDIALLNDNINKITEQIARKKLEIFEPTKTERDKVMNIILDFIKDNKRKVYGGYALNELIKDKKPQDAIYKDYDTPDIDFYSPDPINDIINLCDKLFKAGLKPVLGKEALHKDTYSIFINYTLYCDISYVPKNIYHKMPFKEINYINYIHPHFMLIDYLRMIADPLVSYWRIEKAFKRLYLLNNLYPLPHVKNNIKTPKPDDNINYALNIILDYLKTKSSCVVIGLYAFNHYLESSGVLKQKTKTNFNLVNVFYYEFISTNYKSDVLELLDMLKLKFQSDSITYIEYYNFFQFTGYFTNIYYEKNLIATIYHNNNKCLPYHIIKNLDNSKITIGSFPLLLCFILINIMRIRANNDDTYKDMFYGIASHLVEARNLFFIKNNKNIFSDTIFKDFIIECIGFTQMPDREQRLLLEERKKNNKKYMFKYDPETDTKIIPNYFFQNSSGNMINKKKNLKLTDYVGSDEEPEDDEKNDN